MWSICSSHLIKWYVWPNSVKKVRKLLVQGKQKFQFSFNRHVPPKVKRQGTNLYNCQNTINLDYTKSSAQRKTFQKNNLNEDNEVLS